MFWHCPECGGRTASLAFLRRNAAKEAIDELWTASRNASPRGALPCPACERRMVEVEARSAGGSVEVDVCAPCLFVWFDRDELEALPRKAAAPESRKIPLAARLSEEDRRELAHAQIEDLAVRQRTTGDVAVHEPETPFEWFGWLFGLPIADPGPLTREPIVTIFAALALVVCGILAAILGGAVEAFGLVPAEWSRAGGLTLVTSFFVHANVFHLVGNTYFLLLVGAAAEDLLGHGRLLLLLLAATLAGGAAHVLVDPASAVPAVGASGGISGVMAFFALKTPRAKVSLFLWAHWIRIPALAAFLLWTGLQLVELTYQLRGISNVSAAAHLGGMIVGAAFWLAYRKL